MKGVETAQPPHAVGEPPNRPAARRVPWGLLRLAGAALGVGLLFVFVDIGEAFDSALSVGWANAALMLLILTALVPLRAFRWYVLGRALGMRASYPAYLSAYAGGWFAGMGLSWASSLARMGLLLETEATPGTTLVSIVIDRAFQLGAAALLTAAALLIVFVGGALGLVLAAAVALLGLLATPLCVGLLQRLSRRVRPTAPRLRSGPAVAVAAFSLGLGLLTYAVLLVGAGAVGVSAGAGRVLLASGLISLMQILPLTVFNLGPREGILLATLGNGSREAAVSLGLVLLGLNVINRLSMAPALLWRPAAKKRPDSPRAPAGATTFYLLYGKRLLDLTVASALGLALTPLWLLLLSLTWVDSRGSPLFRQQRCGLGGKTITVWKFRTMRPGVEVRDETAREFAERFKLHQDGRVTPLGRWLRRSSLDELPQLVNVIRGEMSLVGPRPITGLELERYGAWSGRLLTVPPGMTGLWQVSGRNLLPYERRVQLDMEYIGRRGLPADLAILARTVVEVLRRRGAW